MSCFALFDDAGANAALRRSRLYTGYVGTLICDDAAQLPDFLERMQQALVQGRHAVGLFQYELGVQLHGILPHDTRQPPAQVLLFDDCQMMAADEVGAWLTAQESGHHSDHLASGVAGLDASVDEQQFQHAIARIHEYLEAGDTYQVNYTYRLRFDAYGPVASLYRRLRASQPVPYGALIRLPDDRAVLSLSPELFVRHAGGELTVRPMKGTAAASGESALDDARSQALAQDPKNRAENLMIVDLLRNDLGRVAQLGSVQVPQLFEVRRYGQVLQMTSTVTARLREDVTLTTLFTALYPCGSITGAPKHRTMQIIRELEPDPRGIYTGAIGWFQSPDNERSIGDFCLSVPIRTLMLQAPGGHGVRSGEMGVGAGIVHDSRAQDEYAECRLKARFLTGVRQDFALLETMHATRNGCRHLARHLQRLQSSARYFGFVWNEQQVRASVQQACAALPPEGAHRLRLALDQDGRCTLQAAPLMPLTGPVKLLLATEETQAQDLFLRHKTTLRATYDAAWKMAEAQGGFDMLFCNTRGEVTEGARSNLFIQLNGRWVTPPLSAGVLPGVMRSVLLDDPSWNACEQRVTIQDLRAAEAIVVCNALRGAMPAQVMWDSAA